MEASHSFADAKPRPYLAASGRDISTKHLLFLAFGKLSARPFEDQMSAKQGGDGLKPGQDGLVPSLSKERTNVLEYLYKCVKQVIFPILVSQGRRSQAKKGGGLFGRASHLQLH